jgi:NADH dehydrogenase
MSSNGTRPGARTDYHRTKWAAEELVRHSGLAWTIFRPSVIFGPGDSFVNLLAGIIRRAPVVPVIGDGRYAMQPAWVKTVAAGFALALEREDTVGQTFAVGGPDPLTYNRILDLVGETLGSGHPRKLHLPVWLMRAQAEALGRFPWFPITPGQITMLLEGNTCDPRPFYDAFGLEPVRFASALGYLRAG